MDLLVKQAELRGKALGASSTLPEVRAYAQDLLKLARRAEVQRAVTGSFGGGLVDMISSALTVATPMAAAFGDFELSNLLGALKVWVDKRRAQDAAEKARVDALTGKGWEGLNFNYSF